MEYTYYKKEWLPVVVRQEELLRGEMLSEDRVMKLGTIMFRLAKERYGKAAAIRIIMRGQIVFSLKMDGTTLNNDWWMDKKLNVSRVTGLSSIRSLMEIAEGNRMMETVFEEEGSYALYGGCFPYRSAETGKLLGWIEVSGMAHEQDHQLIADGLSELLNIDIPRITE